MVYHSAVAVLLTSADDKHGQRLQGHDSQLPHRLGRFRMFRCAWESLWSDGGRATCRSP